MRTRVPLIGTVLILLALLLTLSPLAYASPPDPTWIPGLWDDDDFDNVVVYITSAASDAPAPIDREFRPAPVFVVLQLPALDAAVTAVPHSASGPRAPPTN
jgi:hypothetical protein